MKLWHVYVALAVIGFLGTGSQVLGYLDAGLVGGISTFVPLFLAHRQRRLEATQFAHG